MSAPHFDEYYFDIVAERLEEVPITIDGTAWLVRFDKRPDHWLIEYRRDDMHATPREVAGANLARAFELLAAEFPLLGAELGQLLEHEAEIEELLDENPEWFEDAHVSRGRFNGGGS